MDAQLHSDVCGALYGLTTRIEQGILCEYQTITGG